ncbi:MAG: hypothetical protein Q8Q62_05735 [Mesorhizobium sp.]|nr:hypothetical protein [Mesorhizobium sp.]
MSFISGLASRAANRRRAREQRRTELLLNELPVEIQRDIGWQSTGRSGQGRPRSVFGWGIPIG